MDVAVPLSFTLKLKVTKFTKKNMFRGSESLLLPVFNSVVNTRCWSCLTLTGLIRKGWVSPSLPR